MNNRTSRLLQAVGDDVQAIPDSDVQHSALPYQSAPLQSISGAVSPSSFATPIEKDDPKLDTFVTKSVEPNGGVKLSQILPHRPKSGVNTFSSNSSLTDFKLELTDGVRLPPSNDENLNERGAKPVDQDNLLLTLDEFTAQKTTNVSVSGKHPSLAAPSTQLSVSNALTEVTNTPSDKPLSNEQSSEIPFSVRNKSDNVQTVASAQPGGSTLPAMSTVEVKNCGDLAPFGKGFCPIVSVSKFPYKFVPASVKQDVASQFFDGGKFWMREWDLHYVHPFDGDKPLVLIPEDQFKELLQEMAPHFPGVHNMTRHQYFRDKELIIDFPDHPRLYPRFLGASRSKADFDYHVGLIPDVGFRAPNEKARPQPEQGDRELFTQIFDDALDMNKSKGKTSKARRMEMQSVRRNMMGSQLKKAQRYLGLRPTFDMVPEDPSKIPNISFQEQVAKENIRNTILRIPRVDAEIKAPYSREHDAIIISVDLEAYEHASSIITEIGIAILDTRHIADIAPGKNGQNWFDKIEAHHLRIKEYEHIVNKTYVQGCPDRFNFGKSDFIASDNAAQVVGLCFEQHSHDTAKGVLLGEAQENRRPIVLLGHNPDVDIRYLQALGFNAYENKSIREVLDTQLIYQVLMDESNPRSLESTLREFGIIPMNLHNAGNDAVYTMQALIAMAVAEAVNRPKSTMYESSPQPTVGDVATLQVDRPAPLVDKGKEVER